MRGAGGGAGLRGVGLGEGVDALIVLHTPNCFQRSLPLVPLAGRLLIEDCVLSSREETREIGNTAAETEVIIENFKIP